MISEEHFYSKILEFYIKIISQLMRRIPQKYQTSRVSSFFTPESDRKASTHRNHFSLIAPNVSHAKQQQFAKKAFSFTFKGEENPQIYFDRVKRRTFIKDVIDGYFKPPISTIQILDQAKANESLLLQNSSVSRKNVYSSDYVRRNARSRQAEAKKASKNTVIEINISSIRDADRLPTINESEFQQRPNSDYRPYRKLAKRSSSPYSPLLGQNQPDLADSLFLDSSKSLMDSKIEQTKDDYSASKVNKALKKKERTFDSKDDEQLIRQKLVSRLGLPVMWRVSKETKLEYPLIKKSLRQLCYSMVEEKRGEEPLFLIFPTQYYFNLFANKCEQIFDIIKAMCKLVIKGNEKISNNQIHINNIHKMQEKHFLLYDWGCSGIAEALEVQGVKYPKFHSPYVRKNDQWLLSPEYLAPELLRAIQYDSFEYLWAQKGGIGICDVWSIGCLVFELITLIPLNHPHHCVIKGKQYSCRGLMGTKIRSIQNITAKQKYLKSLALRRVKDYLKEKDAPIVDSKILHILPKMLEQNPSKRISAAQIISILS